jgi:hypothetical protein
MKTKKPKRGRPPGSTKQPEDLSNYAKGFSAGMDTTIQIATALARYRPEARVEILQRLLEAAIREASDEA